MRRPLLPERRGASRRTPLAVALLAIGALAACADEPTAPQLQHPPRADLATAAAAPRAAGLGLHFLSPLGKARSYTGTFDGSLQPAVEICTWIAGACQGAPLARYTLTEGTGGVRLQLVAAQEHYRVDWPLAGVAAGQVVRIRVLLDGGELGAVSARRPAAGESAASVAAEGYVPLGNTTRLPIRFRLERSDDFVPGAPADPVRVPFAAYAARAEDFAAGHPQLGRAVLSFNTVLLAPAAGAQVGPLNALLASVGAEIVGGLPAGSQPGILVLRLPTTSHAALESALAALRASPVVAQAVQDAGLEPLRITKADALTSGPIDWAWSLTPTGGNWGLELLRVPQLWNLQPAIAKTIVRRSGAVPSTGVLDVGFADVHDDITYLLNMTPGRQEMHGTHVAGIIGATFDNGVGLDGLNPFAQLVVRAPLFFGVGGSVVERRASAAEFMLFGFENLVRARSDLRVVNMSLGYNWGAAGVPQTNPEAQRIATAQGALFATLLRGLEAELGRLPVVVSAAGNDSDSGFGLQDARFSSPQNAAALVHGAAPVIVVEALQPSGTRAAYSNTNGHVFAPGSSVLGLDVSGYIVTGGTSMAAPYVAGLAGLLYTIAPGLPDPTMTTNPMRDLLAATGTAVAGAPTPRIDAFDAALGIDVVVGSDHVLRLLADIDDGTRDGNQRTTAAGADHTEEDADGDWGIGDGRVDMRDFRRWRDWLLAVEQAPTLQLDGSIHHPKHDVNGNGAFGDTGDDESIFPRGDFNGDGLLSRTATRRVGGRLNAPATDLEVLQRLWQDEDVDAAELPSLIESADLELDVTGCLASTDVQHVRVRVFPKGSGTPLVDEVQDRARPVRVYTVPVDAADRTVRVEPIGRDGAVQKTVERDVPMPLGSDTRWAPSCQGLVILPDSIQLDPGQQHLFRAEIDGVPEEDDISWSAVGGKIAYTGRYTAPGTEGTHLVIARSISRPELRDTAFVTVSSRALFVDESAQLYYEIGSPYEPWSGHRELFQKIDPRTTSGGVALSGGNGSSGTLTQLLFGDHGSTTWDWSFSASVSASVVAAASVADGEIRRIDGRAGATAAGSQSSAPAQGHQSTGNGATASASAGFTVEVRGVGVPYTLTYTCSSSIDNEHISAAHVSIRHVDLLGPGGMHSCAGGTSGTFTVTGTLRPGKHRVSFAAWTNRLAIRAGGPSAVSANSSIQVGLAIGR